MLCKALGERAPRIWIWRSRGRVRKEKVDCGLAGGSEAMATPGVNLKPGRCEMKTLVYAVYSL